MVDYRSERMESPEGKGNARRRWQDALGALDNYAATKLDPVLRPIAMNMTADLIGFWLMWHLEGGFEGMRGAGFSRSAIYRRVKRFRQITGVHPDEYQLPGVELRVSEYLASDARLTVFPGLETQERRAGSDST